MLATLEHIEGGEMRRLNLFNLNWGKKITCSMTIGKKCIPQIEQKKFNDV